MAGPCPVFLPISGFSRGGGIELAAFHIHGAIPYTTFLSKSAPGGARVGIGCGCTRGLVFEKPLENSRGPAWGNFPICRPRSTREFRFFASRWEACLGVSKFPAPRGGGQKVSWTFVPVEGQARSIVPALACGIFHHVGSRLDACEKVRGPRLPLGKVLRP